MFKYYVRKDYKGLQEGRKGFNGELKFNQDYMNGRYLADSFCTGMASMMVRVMCKAWEVARVAF